MKEISSNLMLLCKECVKKNYQREKMIAAVTEAAIKQSDKLNLISYGLRYVKSIISEKKTELEKTPNAVEAINKKTDNRNKDKIYDGIRIRGIKVSKESYQRERAEEDNLEAVKFFDFLGVQSKITDAYRLVEYKEGRDRVLLIKLANRWDRRIILFSLYKPKDCDKPVYISRELAPHEWQIENQQLKVRKNLLENGELSRNIRLYNLELQRREGSDWVKYNSE